MSLVHVLKNTYTFVLNSSKCKKILSLGRFPFKGGHLFLFTLLRRSTYRDVSVYLVNWMQKDEPVFQNYS